MSYPNPLVTMCLAYEPAISDTYAAEMRRMTMPNGTRNEDKWVFFGDQDQLYYLVYDIVPGLEKAHDDMQDEHNQFTQWLNAVFEIQAARLGFNGDV